MARKAPRFRDRWRVDPTTYARSNPKILLLLKEVNDFGGGGWCLREFLSGGGRADTWDNVARWTYGIRRLPHEVPWKTLQSITKEIRRKQLRSIAAVNLKKTPGGYTTNVRSFRSAVKQDAEYLRQQFAIYEADIVVCCGTAVVNAFDKFIKSKDSPAWRQTSRGVDYLEYAEKKFVIGYSHPEARISPNVIHYGLVDAVREILPIHQFRPTG